MKGSLKFSSSFDSEGSFDFSFSCDYVVVVEAHSCVHMSRQHF